MRLRKKFSEYKEQAIALRREGNSYADIRSAIGVNLPQSTLSEWLSNLTLSIDERVRLSQRQNEKLRIAREKASETHRLARQKRIEIIRCRVLHLSDLLQNKNIAKIVLAAMYWCEGSKNGDSVSFGNSDPRLIKSFLIFMRQCYEIDESKFRGTVQCRADQDADALEIFWSEVTNIPSSQFYAAKVDPRTVGKPTKKLAYKGVCKVDYFSVELYNELKIISELISEGL